MYRNIFLSKQNLFYSFFDSNSGYFILNRVIFVIILVLLLQLFIFEIELIIEKRDKFYYDIWIVFY